MIRHPLNRQHQERECAGRPYATPCGELCRAIEDRLRGSHYSALWSVSCDDRGGVLRISGHLPSHYLKQIAQEAVSTAVGALPFVNEIEVIAPGSRSAADGGAREHETPGA